MAVLFQAQKGRREFRENFDAGGDPEGGHLIALFDRRKHGADGFK
jgi:hypothetical protein